MPASPEAAPGSHVRPRRLTPPQVWYSRCGSVETSPPADGGNVEASPPTDGGNAFGPLARGGPCSLVGKQRSVCHCGLSLKSPDEELDD